MKHVQGVDDVLKTVDDDGGGVCPVCYEAAATSAWKETPCGHCVDKWLIEANQTWPICRRRLIIMPPPVIGTETEYVPISNPFGTIMDRVLPDQNTYIHMETLDLWVAIRYSLRQNI